MEACRLTHMREMSRQTVVYGLQCTSLHLLVETDGQDPSHNPFYRDGESRFAMWLVYQLFNDWQRLCTS